MRDLCRSDDLQRFVVAQDPVYASVEAELTEGRKRTHWMWFVFPQLRGLGSSFRANFYGIASLGEARAYLEHPMLGARLQTCTSLVKAARERSLREIFGEPDDAKLHSSMTLFSTVSIERSNVFQEMLDLYFEGKGDEKSLALLRNC